eukprot:7296018-Karenia_brevis.AAC.1
MVQIKKTAERAASQPGQSHGGGQPASTSDVVPNLARLQNIGWDLTDKEATDKAKWVLGQCGVSPDSYTAISANSKWKNS